MRDVLGEALGFVSLPKQQQWATFLGHERDQGFTHITNAPWLDWNDWEGDTLITGDGPRIRLVLLRAKRPGQGAFTRLIERIVAAHLVPVIVEPNQSLTDWCERHDYRSRKIGQGRHRHQVWYPRR